jgi:hypothetical protein
MLVVALEEVITGLLVKLLYLLLLVAVEVHITVIPA